MVINKQTLRTGFTLIELLTVIAIIGILAGIIIPTVGNVVENARRTQASSNWRQIALAYNTFALDGPRVKNIPDGSFDKRKTQASNVHEWAGVLAVNAGLNDASFWFISDDDAVQTFPTIVLEGGTENLADDFTSEEAISWSVVSGLARSAPGSSTPLLWSRGYDSSTYKWKARGTTPSDSSPWGTQGGHVVFLDAHVAWKKSGDENNDDGDFVKLGKGTSTKLLSDAVGAAPDEDTAGRSTTKIFNE